MLRVRTNVRNLFWLRRWIQKNRNFSSKGVLNLIEPLVRSLLFWMGWETEAGWEMCVLPWPVPFLDDLGKQRAWLFRPKSTSYFNKFRKIIKQIQFKSPRRHQFNRFGQTLIKTKLEHWFIYCTKFICKNKIKNKYMVPVYGINISRIMAALWNLERMLDLCTPKWSWRKSKGDFSAFNQLCTIVSSEKDTFQIRPSDGKMRKRYSSMAVSLRPLMPRWMGRKRLVGLSSEFGFGNVGRNLAVFRSGWCDRRLRTPSPFPTLN